MAEVLWVSCLAHFMKGISVVNCVSVGFFL